MPGRPILVHCIVVLCELFKIFLLSLILVSYKRINNQTKQIFLVFLGSLEIISCDYLETCSTFMTNAVILGAHILVNKSFFLDDVHARLVQEIERCVNCCNWREKYCPVRLLCVGVNKKNHLDRPRFWSRALLPCKTKYMWCKGTLTCFVLWFFSPFFTHAISLGVNSLRTKSLFRLL